MKCKQIFPALLLFAFAAEAEQVRDEWKPPALGKELTFTAERIIYDNVTKAASATGSVRAVYGVATLRSDRLERDAQGKVTFSEGTAVTTCTNDTDHLHWCIEGGFEYQPGTYAILRSAKLKLFGVPIFYLPYLYAPLDLKTGFSCMPGYTGRWGAYLLTRYDYHLLGNPEHDSETAWLSAATHLDLRMRNGIAFGQDFNWGLGALGTGNFTYYHAWDLKASDRYNENPRFANWGSRVDRNRYGIGFDHRLEPTERDIIYVRASHFADSRFRRDFLRKSFFEANGQWEDYRNSGVFWEHLENAYSFGAEVSGRLNDFYAMTERLPEFYFDVNPQPLFSLPINYESQTRMGWLDRRYAKHVIGDDSVFGALPGKWCDYDSFRLDSYHRVTAPFRTVDDTIAVVPRVGLRGTYWSSAGMTDSYGMSRPKETDDLFRTIGEAGVTFAMRGTGKIDEANTHTIEPYLDVLLQAAGYAGRKSGERPYVFDNLDASMTWEDQFAGRSRNLPYSYYGLTPGVRNVWSRWLEDGSARQLADVDVYAAVMFGGTDFIGDHSYGDYDSHKLAKVGRRNYGRQEVNVMPGVRFRWSPAEDLFVAVRAEYDTDQRMVAMADATLVHKLTRNFSYNIGYGLRDHRYWDFASVPYNEDQMSEDVANYAKFEFLRIGFDYQPLDWLAFGPYVRWDGREHEVESVGGWLDLMTDCLGFRFMLEYVNDYERIDRYRRSDDWRCGFYVYLRAFGADRGGIFSVK